MKAFRFSLEKVLTWRRIQLELEENKLKQQHAVLAAMDRARAELEAAGIRAELEVRDCPSLSGLDLRALAGFRLHVQNEERAIAARRLEFLKQLEAQQNAMLEARRRCRLLERLKERRLAEWQAASDHELEQLAAESYLAGVVRRRG